MIRTEIKDDRGDMRQLTPNDLDYWTGPYRYEPYPKMLFRITQPGQTEAEVCVVTNAHEHSRKGSDWFETPDDARAHFARVEADVAKAAAEANYQDRNMSEAAKAERLAHDRSTDEMVTDVPRRPGRPRKASTVAAE